MIKQFHSYFAYIVLAGLIISVVYALISFVNKRPYTDTSKKISLLGLISAHVQFLFGLVLYFTSPVGMSNLSGETMKDAAARLMAVEHPFAMLLGIVLVTVGYSKAKRLTDDGARHKTILIFYGLGLLLVLSRIPWQTWL